MGVSAQNATIVFKTAGSGKTGEGKVDRHFRSTLNEN